MVLPVRDTLHWATVDNWVPIVLKMPQDAVRCSVKNLTLMFAIRSMKLVVLTKGVLVKWPEYN
jgi:hypothetical protein